jgi:Ca2+-binding RTX toxin-like protein
MMTEGTGQGQRNSEAHMPLIPETWLDQFTVNTTTTGSQLDPAVIQLANGNILVSWTSGDDSGPGSPAGTDIIGQLFDPLGNPLGSEFRLNTDFFSDAENDSELAALPSGGFLLVYEDLAVSNSIRLEQYGANGSPLNGSTIVSDLVAAAPSSANPRIAVSSNTSALVLFERFDAGNTTIRGRIYDSTTNSLGAEFAVIAFAGGNIDADVAVLNNGNYAIVARRNLADSSITLRIVDPTGANVLGVTPVQGTSGDGFDQSDASVAALNNGNFVVTFVDPDANDTDIRFVIYTAAGAVVTSGSAGINSAGTTNDNNEPKVVALADGGFVIVLDNDTSDDRLEVTHVSSAGVVLGSAIVAVDPATSLRVVGLADGRFAVVWQAISGEIQMKIMDTRDNANGTLVYTPDNWQVGTVGDDTFTANANSEIVHGWVGNDTITENGIVKQYFGDEGNDTIIVTSVINADFHDGGTGIDTIDWSSSPATGATFDLALGTAKQGASTEQMLNFENLIGTANKDRILGTSGSNELEGGDGNDFLNGRAGADIMRGGDGKDRYRVDHVDDQVIEIKGEGVDRVDSVINYSLVGKNIENLELLTSANLNGTGNKLDNKIFGNNGQNVLRGADGNDALSGKDGHDRLEGGDGRDTLVGGKGADILFGGIGKDTLKGQAGADTFRFTNASQSTVEGGGRDLITAFSRIQGDKIDLSAIDAKSGGGNQAFIFIGDAAFTGVKGQLRSFFAGSTTLVQGDRDGDSVADFAIQIGEIVTLAGGDFVL